MVQRRLLNQHHSECEYRLVECACCGITQRDKDKKVKLKVVKLNLWIIKPYLTYRKGYKKNLKSVLFTLLAKTLQLFFLKKKTVFLDSIKKWALWDEKFHKDAKWDGI